MVSRKEDIKKLMRRHLIISNREMMQAIEFVGELIDLQLTHDEEAYPKAINSHARNRIAYEIVRDLDEFVEEHLG